MNTFVEICDECLRGHLESQFLFVQKKFTLYIEVEKYNPIFLMYDEK